MALLADLKPTNSLPFSNLPVALGIQSLPNSVNTSPVHGAQNGKNGMSSLDGHANGATLATAAAAALSAGELSCFCGLMLQPCGYVMAGGLCTWCPCSLGAGMPVGNQPSAQPTPYLHPSNHGIMSNQPTPLLNNSAAAPASLHHGHVSNQMLLRPDMLVAEPDLAQILAMKLGMDQTHQIAAQKAAHILK